MWSSEARQLRGLGWSLVLVAALALGGCTGLRPVYGDNGITAQRIEVQYAKPANRLEQVIYQDLALKLGKSSGDVPTVTVSVNNGARSLGGDSSPHSQNQMVVSAFITVVSSTGAVLFSGSRSQTADYTTGAQVGANERAAQDASLRAARLLADTIRLQILATLGK